MGIQDLITTDGFVSWKYVEDLHSLQESEGLHVANKLRKAHIAWRDQTMKVKLAAQTLSESVATAFDFLRDKGVSEFIGSEATSKFFRSFNILFDILNSRSNKGYSFKKALNEINFLSTRCKLLEIYNYISSIRDSKKQFNS